MPDLRKVYKAMPGASEGANIPQGWKIAQGLTVTPDKHFAWNQFTTHLTIERWDTDGQIKRIRKFHLSFKQWRGEPMNPQPGCTWEWNSSRSIFEFKGWFAVPFLYLNRGNGEHHVIAKKTNEFLFKYIESLLIDKFMWAALGDATPPPNTAF